MVEAVMFWNEPNNKSHWDFSLDPEWRVYGEMVKLAANAVAAENPRLVRVLGVRKHATMTPFTAFTG